MPLVTAGVLQQACDCVLSVDILAVCIDVMRGAVGVSTGELVFAIDVGVSFETVVREADLESEEREADVARATARIILWEGICQGTLMSMWSLYPELPRRCVNL